jgi:thioredoxin-related protein
MSKFERVFYVVVILAMFALVILFQIRLKESRHRLDVTGQFSQVQSRHVYSFEGELPDGEKSFVHFTAYSSRYYIFLNSSNDCPHCLSMLQHLQTFNPGDKLPEHTSIYLIAEEFIDPMPPVDSPVKLLKISFEDHFQFGQETPSVTVVDGRGNLIFRWKGYSPEIFMQAIKTIREFDKANSRSIRGNNN